MLKLTVPKSQWLGLLLPLLLTGFCANAETCVRNDVITKYRFVPNCIGEEMVPGRNVPYFYTNSQGLLFSPEYAKKPAPGVYRILMLSHSSFVNQGAGIGVVPSIEKTLNSLWPKHERPFRSVEVINGSFGGYSLAQTYVILPELLDAYSPDMVLLGQSYYFYPETTVQDHFSALKTNPSTGLPSALGENRMFWPLPASTRPQVWSFLRRWGFSDEKIFQLSVYDMAVELGYRWGITALTDLFHPRAPASTPAMLHLQYMEAIRKASEARGASFCTLNYLPTYDEYRKDRELSETKGISYSPTAMAEHFFGIGATRSDIDYVRREVLARFQTVDWSDLWQLTRKEMRHEDLHFTSRGALEIGAKLGERLFPLVLKEASRRRIGVRGRNPR